MKKEVFDWRKVNYKTKKTKAGYSQGIYYSNKPILPLEILLGIIPK